MHHTEHAAASAAASGCLWLLHGSHRDSAQQLCQAPWVSTFSYSCLVRWVPWQCDRLAAAMQSQTLWDAHQGSQAASLVHRHAVAVCAGRVRLACQRVVRHVGVIFPGRVDGGAGCVRVLALCQPVAHALHGWEGLLGGQGIHLSNIRCLVRSASDAGVCARAPQHDLPPQ